MDGGHINCVFNREVNHCWSHAQSGLTRERKRRKHALSFSFLYVSLESERKSKTLETNTKAEIIGHK
jgi:hypothetical protein